MPRHIRRSLLVAATLTAASTTAVLSGSAYAASHHPASPHVRAAASCPAAKKTYAKANSAHNSGNLTKVRANPASFHCGGPDDGSYKVSHVKETLTLHSSAVVKVFNNPQDPSKGYRKIAPSQLPHWLKKNSSEPIYQISGKRTDVTRMVEKFHP